MKKFVVELAVLLPSAKPEGDIERLKLLIEKLREYGLDLEIQVREIRWSS